VPANYLKKFYTDDRKLAQRARLEFFRALETGRMIAFAGSMTTQPFGYGSWSYLRMLFTMHAVDVVKALDGSSGRPRFSSLIDRIREFDRLSVKTWDPIIGMKMIEEILDDPDLTRAFRISLRLPANFPDSGAWPLDRFDSPREAVRVLLAQSFRTPSSDNRIGMVAPVLRDSDDNDRFNIPLALWGKLGIRRFATPSYDFEYEREMMIGHLYDKAGNIASPFDQLRDLDRNQSDESFEWDLGSGRIRRVFSDGWAIESDIVNRERIDRMIEFSVGTDDVDGHVMHMHGRACNWRSMIVTQHDYDRMYRREDLNRAPFERAKRMMMGGNPTLFVGLGMTEEDLNRELREFVSNAPYQRIAPSFLLWNATTAGLNENGRKSKRLEILSRYGVLTMFDADFEEISDEDIDLRAQDRERLRPHTSGIEHVFSQHLSVRMDEFQIIGREINKSLENSMSDLRKLIETLVDPSNDAASGRKKALTNPTLREMYIGKRWRSMLGRTARQGTGAKPIVLWGRADRSGHASDNAAASKLIKSLGTAPVLAVIGRQGSGKGSLVQNLLELVELNPRALGLAAADHCLVVNGGFSFDTDTLLDGLAHFLGRVSGRIGEWKDRPDEKDRGDRPLVSRARFLKRLIRDRRSPHVLIVVNGMDRFCEINGSPLSAEFDDVLNEIIKHRSAMTRSRIQLVLLGTERIRKYCRNDLCINPIKIEEIVPSTSDDESEAKIPGKYLAEVAGKFAFSDKQPNSLRNAVASYHANASGRISGDSIGVRKALFDTLFDGRAWMNLAQFREEEEAAAFIDLSRRILRYLAFVGSPVDRNVLEILARKGAGGVLPDETFGRAIGKLKECRLIFELQAYRSPDGNDDVSRRCRYALHRTLLTELRFRFGIPLNEAKLSTAFNMSLYIAQPIDGDIPDTDIHEELGNSIDTLIGSYKNVGSETEKLWDVMISGHQDRNDLLAEAAAYCGSSERVDQLDDAQRIPALKRILALCQPDHVRALRAALAIARGYYSTTGLLTVDSGDRVAIDHRDGVLLEHAERLDALIDAYGKQAMARDFLRDKWEEVFEKHLGKEEPFYPDELVWLHNERGVVRLAMGDLYEARRSFDQAMRINRKWVEADDRGHNWRRIRLNQLTVDVEMGELGRAERICEEIEEVTHPNGPSRKEDMLALAIVAGHRGWCSHLRGDVNRARDHYQKALDRFSTLGEVRAYAYFGRLRAGLPNDNATFSERLSALGSALDIAQSGRQMDIVHRIQISLATTMLFADKLPPSDSDRRRANRMLEEALTYSLHTEVHRVRCEASSAIARTREQTGDYEGAMRYAMDALMVATRYGMELRKISLRAMIAKIMAARGHPVTAERLARTCIKMATRKRFQTAIDRAEQVILDIPRISTSITRSDNSGRGDF